MDAHILQIHSSSVFLFPQCTAHDNFCNYQQNTHYLCSHTLLKWQVSDLQWAKPKSTPRHHIPGLTNKIMRLQGKRNENKYSMVDIKGCSLYKLSLTVPLPETTKKIPQLSLPPPPP